MIAYRCRSGVHGFAAQRHKCKVVLRQRGGGQHLLRTALAWLHPHAKCDVCDTQMREKKGVDPDGTALSIGGDTESGMG